MARTAGRTQLKNKLSNETKSFLIAVKQNTKPEHSCAGPLSCNATSPQLRWIREMCCHCCGLIIGMEVLTGGSLLRAVRETLGGLLSGFCLLATVDLRSALIPVSVFARLSLPALCLLRLSFVYEQLILPWSEEVGWAASPGSQLPTAFSALHFSN